RRAIMEIRRAAALALAEGLANAIEDPEWPAKRILDESHFSDVLYHDADTMLAAVDPLIRDDERQLFGSQLAQQCYEASRGCERNGLPDAAEWWFRFYI